MLNSEPEMNENAPKTVLQTWKKLGPLKIEDIINNSKDFLDIDPNEIEFKESNGVNDENKKLKEIGFFKKGTNRLEGLCRRVFDYG